MGRELLRSAEQFAKDKGCIRVHLETRNDKARDLYETLGYSIFGFLPNYEGESSFYYLEKRLDQSDATYRTPNKYAAKSIYHK